MTTRVPALFYQRLLSRTITSPILFLVSVTHSRLVDGIHMTNGLDGLTVGGVFYQNYPLTVELPTAPDEMAPRASLHLSNSSGDLIDEFETLQGFRGGAATIGLYDPNTKLIGMELSLNILSSSMSYSELSFELGYDHFDRLPAVPIFRRPENQPGVF